MQLWLICKKLRNQEGGKSQHCLVGKSERIVQKLRVQSFMLSFVTFHTILIELKGLSSPLLPMHYLTLSVGLSISVINEVCVVSRSAAWPLKLALFPLSWAGLYVMHTGCASFFCWLTIWQQKSRFLLNLPVFCHKHRCTSISRLKNPNPNFGYPKCSFVCIQAAFPS